MAIAHLMSSLIPAVILSEGPGGLGATRALAREGVEVTAVAFSDADMVCYSRYPHRVIRLFNTDNRDAMLLNTLLNLPAPHYALLYSSDRMLDFVLRHQQPLSTKFGFSCPNPNMLSALNDKKAETRLMQSMGIPLPKTLQQVPSNPHQILAELSLPIIFKPALYTARDVFPHKNWVVHTEQALCEFLQQWQAILSRFIAQEVIPGPDSACWICSCTFDREHTLLDCGVKQKLRASPAHFGGSSFAISRANPEVVALTQQLGKQLEYQGHAGIEFRWDSRDQRYKYIEINPRLPANVGFDQDCGLYTVWNSYQVALGEHKFKQGEQKTRYFINFWSDFFSQKSTNTPAIEIAKNALKHLFKPLSGMYFKWHDPLPSLVLTWQIITKKRH